MSKRWSRLLPLFTAIDHFKAESTQLTSMRPFIRDSIDVKRWMFLVIVALLPATAMALWNTGTLKWVYDSHDGQLMREYLAASTSLKTYFNFVFSEGRYLTILKLGAMTFLPIVLISYLVGGLCEIIVACVRGHEISEGFLVTGILFPLTLPSTIPYWMVAVGIAFGVIVGKELFGGGGMNILNPALLARCFLFFTFPGKLTGDVWIGSNPTTTAQSLAAMNAGRDALAIDGFSQATPLATLNAAVPEIKRIHIDAIASNQIGQKVETFETLQARFEAWQPLEGIKEELGHLSSHQLQAFVTTPLQEGGLGLAPNHYGSAHQLADTFYGLGSFSDGNLFFGNIAGAMGETSTLACLLGAAFLLWVGIASWRTMLAVSLSAFLTALCFEWAACHLGAEAGAFNSARFAMPAWRHLLMGGLAFGAVFMATDPVTSCSLNASKWIFGALIGMLTIVIRLINPAFPEGVMLAILFANIFAPLIDHCMLAHYRKPYVKAIHGQEQ